MDFGLDNINGYLLRYLRSNSKFVTMTELKKLKLQYPDCYYDADMDTICIDVNEGPQTVAEEAKELIEWHYEGEKVPVNSGSNPEDETWEKGAGKEFIEYEFENDYHAAFEAV